MKHRSKNFHSAGIVLKRVNLGETDRVVTLLTQDYGRLTAVAKGVRKLSSSKRAYLEPGNYVQAYFIKTKSMPLLVQAKLLDDVGQVRNELKQIRKLIQFLEVLEKLFVEEKIAATMFEQILSLRQGIVNKKLKNTQIKQKLEDLIEQLGFRRPSLTNFDSILDYVSELADKPMRSFKYLAPNHKV